MQRRPMQRSVCTDSAATSVGPHLLPPCRIFVQLIDAAHLYRTCPDDRCGSRTRYRQLTSRVGTRGGVTSARREDRVSNAPPMACSLSVNKWTSCQLTAAAKQDTPSQVISPPELYRSAHFAPPTARVIARHLTISSAPPPSTPRQWAHSNARHHPAPATHSRISKRRIYLCAMHACS
jgi:hypothetical protein